MGMKVRHRRHPWIAALLFVLAICVAPVLAGAADLPDVDGAAPADDPSRIERWNALKSAFFNKKEVQEGTAVIKIDAPPRAMDAALVPLTLNVIGGKQVKGVYLIIDNNPSPL